MQVKKKSKAEADKANRKRSKMSSVGAGIELG